jgi:hypothetical protein
VPGLPPPLVLVDDSIILGLQDRIKALLQKVAAMQRDAQYQVQHHKELAAQLGPCTHKVSPNFDVHAAHRD